MGPDVDPKGTENVEDEFSHLVYGAKRNNFPSFRTWVRRKGKSFFGLWVQNI